LKLEEVNNLEKKIGEVTHYFGHIPAGIIKLAGSLKKGAKVHFKGATTDFTQGISSMQVDHKDIDTAKKGDEIGVKTDDRVREGDEVFLVE
jgi:putative protease